MKKRGGVAVEILMLLGGCLLLPTTIWASSIYGPSGAQATAGVFDNGGSSLIAFCNSGLISSVASCDTGTILGYSSAGPAFSGSASSNAAVATGGLTVTTGGAGADGIQEGAGAVINDTLYFHGGNAQQTGQITMTATGTLAGNDSYAMVSLRDHFTYPLYMPYGFAGNGPWENITAAWTNQLGSTCYSPSALPTEVCASSDGQNLSVSVTFPLSVDGVYFIFAMNGVSSGDGAVSYTDPITVTLPPGVTFTSDSGQFLTQPEGSPTVPEPSSAWLLGIGMASIVLGTVRHTKKKFASMI